MKPPAKPLERTQTAYLPSEGYDKTRATLHTFVRLEPVPADQLEYSAEHGPRGSRHGVAVIYRCSETGVERIWGME